MRNLFDIIYDETFGGYLRWKVKTKTEFCITKEDFMRLMEDEVSWALESMWVLIRFNRIKPSDHLNEFKNVFNEAITIINNSRLCRNNSLENRERVFDEWVDRCNLLTSNSLNVYAIRRIREEGVDTDSPECQEVINSFFDEFKRIKEAVLTNNLEYVNEI